MISRTLVAAAALFIATDIVAQCTITLDLQRYTTNGTEGDQVVATATNNAGCSDRSAALIRPVGAVNWWIEGYCDLPSCTVTAAPRALACWLPGEHVIEAVGHCKVPDGDGNCVPAPNVRTTATITIAPYVASLSVGQTEVSKPDGSIRWRLDPAYSFPNTGSRSISYHDAKTGGSIPYACDHCDVNHPLHGHGHDRRKWQ